MADYQDEIEHWERCLAEESLPALNPQTRPGIFPVPVIPCVYAARQRVEMPRVLDIGCGPLSQLAWGQEQDLIDLVAVDPLAKFYSELLERCGIDYPVLPMEGVGEELSSLFDPGSFDVIYCGNALDHVQSPKVCIEQMYAVLKTSGFLVISSRWREGTHENWHGLHQHDLVADEGNLIRFDKNSTRTNLTEAFDLNCIGQFIKGKNPGDEFHIVFQKAAQSDLFISSLMKRLNSDTMSRSNPEAIADCFPAEVTQILRAGPITVLELGSGPFSSLAAGQLTGSLNVTAFDPLAAIYQDFLGRAGFRYPIEAKALSDNNALSELSTFDLVYLGSGIDHHGSLRDFFSQVSKLLKCNAALIIESRRDEQSWHDWTGNPFHDWQPEEAGDSLRILCSGPEGSFFVNELRLTKLVQNDSGFVAVMQRN